MLKAKNREVELRDIEDKALRREVTRLGNAADALADQIADLAAKRQEAMTRLEELAKTHRLSKITGNGWVLSRCKGGRADLSKERLLEMGVKMKTIEAATVVRRWTYYRLSPINGGE